MTTSAPDHRPVLVGIADTASGRAALDAGVALARLEHAPLRLIRVWRDVDWFLSARNTDIATLVAEERSDEALLADALAHVRHITPDVDVEAELAPGTVFGILLQRSESARHLVLGARGPGTSPGLIASWYLEHARCPVRIVAADGTTVAQSDGRTAPAGSAGVGASVHA